MVPETTFVLLFDVQSTAPQRPSQEDKMKDVYSVVIWLRDSGIVPLGVSQVQVDPGELPSGHRSFVFNSPALPRVHYAHFPTREEAEITLRTLGKAIQVGEVLYVTGEASFAIPAHSVHYLALGHSTANEINPDEGTLEALKAHELRAHQTQEEV